MLMVTTVWVEGGMGVIFNGYRVSVHENEKVLEMDSVRLHNIVNVLSSTELYA